MAKQRNELRLFIGCSIEWNEAGETRKGTVKALTTNRDGEQMLSVIPEGETKPKLIKLAQMQRVVSIQGASKQ